MPYDEIYFETEKDPMSTLIEFLDKHNLNDGESPVYLHFNQKLDTFIVSWPDPVPAHLINRR